MISAVNTAYLKCSCYFLECGPTMKFSQMKKKTPSRYSKSKSGMIPAANAPIYALRNNNAIGIATTYSVSVTTS